MATMPVTDQTQSLSPSHPSRGCRARPRRVQGPAKPETGRRKLQLEITRTSKVPGAPRLAPGSGAVMAFGYLRRPTLVTGKQI